MHAAITSAMLRQFPAALKLDDRVLDITPDDPYVMASKAGIYQVQGDLQEAAKFLSEKIGLSSGDISVNVRQFRLERNYAEGVRLLQARRARLDYDSDQVALAFAQPLAGDAAGAKTMAVQARNTFERLYRNQPDNVYLATSLSQAYAALGEKDSAQKVAERAVMLRPTVKERQEGPAFEENLALIQMIFGDNSRAISTLTRLLHTPYQSRLDGPAPVTPALLRFDPIWDPLRSHPAFRKLCEEKAK